MQPRRDIVISSRALVCFFEKEFSNKENTLSTAAGEG